jgi:hypothetical protein
MSNCALCDTPLTPENDSREHIILNAIGGRRTVSGFICAPCNNTSGHTWDAALAKQLNAFSLFFHITRQDGEPPAQVFPTVSGGTIRVAYDGLELPKPTIEKTPHGAGAKIQVAARTMAEAREILTGLKRKHPEIDIDATLASATSTYSYMTEPVTMNVVIGGPDAGRSIVKSAFALAVASGVAASDCDEAKRYLVSGEDACFGYFNEVNLMEGRPPSTVVHCVAVNSTDDGLLLGYVELFSAFRMVVCLGSNYRGTPINAIYAIDPVKGLDLDVTVRLNFSREDLVDIFEYRRIPDGSIPQALHEIIPDAIRREFEREKATVINRAFKDAWSKLNLAPDTILTQEHMLKLSGLIVEGMMPFFRHHAQQHRNAPQQGIPAPPKDGTEKGA